MDEEIEAIERHAAEHRCVDPPIENGKPGHDALCLCGTTVLMLCDDCFTPVFMAYNPNVEPCEHVWQIVGEIDTKAWKLVPREVLEEMMFRDFMPGSGLT